MDEQVRPGRTFRIPHFPHPLTWVINHVADGEVWADPAGTQPENFGFLAICRVEEVAEKDKQAQEQLDGTLDLYPTQLKVGDEFILKQGNSREWYVIAKIAPAPATMAELAREDTFYSEEDLANWVWIKLKDDDAPLNEDDDMSFWSTHSLCNYRLYGEIVIKGYDKEFDDITTDPKIRIHRKKKDYDTFYMEDAVKEMREHEKRRTQP